MNRTKKNILLIAIALALVGCMIFTAHSAGASLANSFGTPPQMMQGGPSGSNDQNNSSDQNNSGDENGSDDQDNSGNQNGSGNVNKSEDQNSSDNAGSSQSQGSTDQNGGSDKGQSSDSDQNGNTKGAPPSGNNNSGDSTDKSQNSNDQNGNTKGAPPSGNNNSNDSSNNGQPPTPPNFDSENGDMPTPPDFDSENGDMPTPPDFDSENGDMPTPPDFDSENGNMPNFGKTSISDISTPYFILFGAEGLAFALVLMYLIMSGMNRKTMRETFMVPVNDAGNLDFVDTENSGTEQLTNEMVPADEADSLAVSDDSGLAISDDPELTVSNDSGLNATGSTGFILNKKKLAAFIVAVLLIGGALVPAQAALAATAFASNGPSFDQQMPGGSGGSDQQSSVEATGATTVDGTEETLNDTYTSTNADENAILVTNGGTMTSNGATINKESGDSSNTESSDFSGVNSGLLVQENSTATVKNATIKTSAKGANAVFATGENAKISISDSTITTTGEASSRGLDATYGGTIEADNVTISTQGGSCAAMATDRDEGTVSATDSKLETNGAGSPLIYSTGDITLTDSTGTANGSQITVVEGKNSATVENSKLTCSGTGNRGDVDIAGIMIYQSMSGDADEGTGNFTAKNSTLSISKDSNYYKTAPMFFVTNTDAIIDLTDTDLNFGSGVLLSAQGTSEWGSEGSNGGDVTLNGTDQNLRGDIVLDELSTLSMNLTGSTYEGTINGDNTASSVALKLDADSKITLTGDSYVSSLEDADESYSNIDFNGHKLYVDGKAIN